MTATPQTGRETAQTIELPLTPDLYKIISAESGKKERMLYLFIAGFLAFGIGLGALLDVWVVGLAVGIGGALIMWLALLWYRRGVGKDMRERNYLRYTGPIAVEEVTASSDDDNASPTTYRVILADCRFHTSGDLAKKIAGVSWGTVDHTKHSHVVFEVRDRDGKSVYRQKGHQPTA